MLKVELEAKNKLAMAVFIEMGTYDIMQDVREFKIYINDRLFYHDKYFSPLEFCRYAIEWLERDKGWLKRKNDFAYDTIETDDNPQIAFRIVEGGWKLESVWQEFVCDNIFSDDEVKYFINEIISQVVC
ncbi:MAG: hypothetical protein FWC32_00925 [Firmicutes bacterium]|nr:hypothetical protein [Bacillota bacterium]